jgi:hypothetical protein
LGVSVLAAALTLAVQMAPMSLDELVARADVVLHGKVLSKTCQRDPAGRIYTEVDLEVAEAWKGAVAGKRFKVVLAGGTLGDRHVGVSGQADYQPGEEVVAFLRLNPRGEGVTLGLAQGKFEVRQDSVTGRKYAYSAFVGRANRAASRVATQGLEANGLILLADLKRRVQGGGQ